MEKKKDFTLKHREDVIDTLRLRAKEKKVMYGLMLILLLTIAYENGGQIVGHLFNEDFVTPALGKRKKAIVKTTRIKEIEKKVKDVKMALPQFGRVISEYQLRLNNAHTLSKNMQNSEEATKMMLELAKELYRFVTHPVMPENKELEVLKQDLENLKKRFKLVYDTDFEIKPVYLIKPEVRQNNRISRSLFQYENF
jgi:hypothetical protein